MQLGVTHKRNILIFVILPFPPHHAFLVICTVIKRLLNLSPCKSIVTIYGKTLITAMTRFEIKSFVVIIGGEEISGDVCEQALEQVELGGQRSRHPVCRRSLSLPTDGTS